MQLSLTRPRLNLRTVAAVISALVALGGGVSAFALSDYAPATHSFVNDRVDSALQATNARMANLQRESSQTRLQINQLRGEALRSHKFEVDQALAGAPDAITRRLLQERAAELAEAIDDVAAERKRLQDQSP